MFILGFIVCYRESPDSTFEVYLEVSHPGTHSSGKCLKVGANSFRVCNIMLCCIQQCAITAGFKHGYYLLFRNGYRNQQCRLFNPMRSAQVEHTAKWFSDFYFYFLLLWWHQLGGPKNTVYQVQSINLI